MRKKIIIALILFIILLGIVYLVVINWDYQKDELNVIGQGNEYQPEEEISDDQMRQTMISLYYEDKQTKELTAEGRLVDAKKLIDDPYHTILEMLKEDPRNENLKALIPKDTKINKIELKQDILCIDFSKEFVQTENIDLQSQNNLIYSIVNTMTELTEINGIKINIDGNENSDFYDNQIKLNESFVRKI